MSHLLMQIKAAVEIHVEHGVSQSAQGDPVVLLEDVHEALWGLGRVAYISKRVANQYGGTTTNDGRGTKTEDGDENGLLEVDSTIPATRLGPLQGEAASDRKETALGSEVFASSSTTDGTTQSEGSVSAAAAHQAQSS